MSRSKKRKASAKEESHEEPTKKKQAVQEAGQKGFVEHEDDLSMSDPDASDISEKEDMEQDEVEWSGFGEGDDGQTSSHVVAGSSKKKKGIPTGEELRAIKEGVELFKSNTFKLQIESLLASVRVKETNSQLPALEKFLHLLHSRLLSMKSVSPRQPLQASRELLKHDIAVPYAVPLPTEESNWTVAFEKPSDIYVAGSWPTKSGVKSRNEDARWTVDLALEMPAGLFQEKDYLDGRFFHKRAYYLAAVAKELKASKLNVDLLYESAHGDTRLTTLLLRPRKDDTPTDFAKLKAQIRLLPVLSASAPINLNHLSPQHSNIRLKSPSSSTTSNSSAPHPTPIYNTSLLLHNTTRDRLLHTHSLIQSVPSFRDALALLRVWANQRGFCAGKPKPGQGYIFGFEDCGPLWVSLLGVLINGEQPIDEARKKSSRRAVGKGLSSYQLFKAALSFLARHDFSQEPVYEKSKNGHRFSPETYRSHHVSVFVDSTSCVNLLARIPASSLELLRLDAKITLEMFESSAPDSVQFEQAFMKDKSDVWTRFDVILRVSLSSIKPRKPDSVISILDCGSAEVHHLHRLCSLLRRALSDRVKAFAFIIPPSSTRPLSLAHASLPLSEVYIGLIIDAANAFRLVDHGPPASETDTPETLAFRDLWGPKAELRRFKDGRITESVVWNVRNSDERAHIPAMIVRHILEYHFDVEAKEVKGCQAQFDSTLKLPERISGLLQDAQVSTGFKAALAAFDGLVRDIKSLDEALPLALLNVSPVDPHLRYTSTFAPTPLPARLTSAIPSQARYLPSMEIILQFERSGQWPDDLAAIQTTKLAFFERIGSSLMEKVPGLRADVVVGDGCSKSDIIDQAYLQVITADGWAFSARIWHDREATLLQELLREKRLPKQVPGVKAPASDTEVDSPIKRKRASEALDLYTRRFIHSPKHHRAIAAMCHHFPAYPGTVRLVKRWMSSHWLLGGQVSEEAVELLCATVFLNRSRQIGEEDADRAGTPGTKEVGFARVIAFLKEWMWEEGELFIPVYESNGGEEISETTTTISTSKAKSGPVSGVWTFLTKEDPTGHMWTYRGPNALVARWIRGLASATLDAIHGALNGEKMVKNLFIHPTDHYDILIQINPTATNRCHQSVTVNDSELNPFAGRKFANIPNAGADGASVWPAFDPVAMLYHDLKRAYDGTLEFFFDVHGGLTIGALWEPSLTSERAFRVLAGFSSRPVPVETSGTKSKGSDRIVLNRAAVLAEIERLGAGLVKTIVVQK